MESVAAAVRAAVCAAAVWILNRVGRLIARAVRALSGPPPADGTDPSPTAPERQGGAERRSRSPHGSPRGRGGDDDGSGSDDDDDDGSSEDGGGGVDDVAEGGVQRAYDNSDSGWETEEEEDEDEEGSAPDGGSADRLCALRPSESAGGAGVACPSSPLRRRMGRVVTVTVPTPPACFARPTYT